MMINNVFSIPVHEKTEVVIDQIINFKHFCPECVIVLHISRGFDFEHSFHSRKEFLSILKTFDNVFVNPTSLDTQWAEIIQTHVSNFKYISTVTDFNYFILSASNELFVRRMPDDFTKNYDVGNDDKVFLELTNWAWYEHFKADIYLLRILEYFNATLNDVRKSQIEGSFYRREIFADIVRVIDHFYNFDRISKERRIICPREEIYYSTIAHLLNKNLRNAGKLITFAAWDRPDMLPTMEDINEVIAGKKNDACSIKRVMRDFNDLMRFHIGSTIGKYRQQSVDAVRSRCLKKFLNLFNLTSGKRRFFIGHKQHEDFIKHYFKIKPYENYMSFTENDDVIFLDDVLKSMYNNSDALFVICTPMYPMALNTLQRAGFREDVNFIDGWFLLEN